MKTTTTPIAPTTRHATFRLLAALFFLCLFAPVAMGENNTYWQDQQSEVAEKIENKGEGAGGENDPILIATRAELIYFAKQVNNRGQIVLGDGGDLIEHNGKGTDSFEGYYFALTSDIDLSEHYWTPIGNVNHPFYGNFDGGGHRVSGLKVKVEAEIEAYVGLFGKTSNGTIQNLGVCLAEEGIQATTKTESGLAYVGGIAGQALSIRNCYVEGPKTGTAKVIAIAPQKGVCFAGGIVGSLLVSSSITHCYATVDVTAEGDYESYAGGIAGRSQGSIFYTYATGAVEATNGDNCAGGICGFAPQKSSLSNNLALNKSIKGGKGISNRILGVGQATLTSNYASPEMLVNGSVVNGEAGAEADKDVNGDPSITFNNLEEKLRNEWEKNGWTFPADDCLPQLKIRTDDSPSYDNWPVGVGFTPQPTLNTATFLPGSIANADNHDGLSWEKAIQIANRAELIYFAKQVNAGKDLVVSKGVSSGTIENNPPNQGFEGYYFALTSDIVLSGYYWTPIGTAANPFNGNFNGGGYCVKDLKVSGMEDAGLFGYAEVGTLCNLGVHLVQEGVQGSASAGGIAGTAANINNCYVVGAGMVKTVNYSGSSYAGGIVGCLTGSLSNCYATINVVAEGSDKNCAGGIAGMVSKENSAVSYTYTTGNVYAKGSNLKDNNAGGICGMTHGSLSYNLAANGMIGGEDLENCHRIVGKVDGNASLTSNFASTKTTLNPSAGDILPTADGLNGADIWIETFHTDLIPDLADKTNGWATAWDWSKDDSGNLPKLKKVEDKEGSFTYGGVLTGQSDIDPNLSNAKDSPLILGAHIAAGVSVDLTNKNGKWLCDIPGSQKPSRPFNGTVKGADCPVTILKPENSSDTPELIFDGVIWRNNETFLTISDGAELIMIVNNKVNINANATNPAIVNAGTLTIKAGNPNTLKADLPLSNTLTVSSPSVAIKNTGTLILKGNGIYLVGGERTIDNEGEGTVSFSSPMVEWQFALALKDKVIKWGDVTFELNKPAYDLCQSVATTYVPVGTSFDLTASLAGNPVIQQGLGAGSNYITSFTAQDGKRTIFTDVKDCPCLHLLQPAGGDLTVTAGTNGSPLSDGAYVATGTPLTLSCPPKDNYIFESYLCGSAADNLPDLQGNVVTIGKSDLWLSARLRYERPTPPPPPVPVYYTVTLPQVEGATTDPGPGEYEVESWSTFRFYLTIDSAYSESQPVVTTDRGETLKPRSSDGAYLINDVCSDVEVFIDGLIQNPPPVANEAIGTDGLVPQIWAEGSMLCIRMAEALPSAPVRIFTVDGRLYDNFASTPGLNRRQLPTGIYIVRVGDTACKVIVK